MYKNDPQRSLLSDLHITHLYLCLFGQMQLYYAEAHLFHKLKVSILNSL